MVEAVDLSLARAHIATRPPFDDPQLREALDGLAAASKTLVLAKRTPGTQLHATFAEFRYGQGRANLVDLRPVFHAAPEGDSYAIFAQLPRKPDEASMFLYAARYTLHIGGEKRSGGESSDSFVRLRAGNLALIELAQVHNDELQSPPREVRRSVDPRSIVVSLRRAVSLLHSADGSTVEWRHAPLDTPTPLPLWLRRHGR